MAQAAKEFEQNKLKGGIFGAVSSPTFATYTSASSVA